MKYIKHAAIAIVSASLLLRSCNGEIQHEEHDIVEEGSQSHHTANLRRRQGSFFPLNLPYNNHDSADLSPIVHDKRKNNENRQRVVLLAGPFKTGSSSMQENIYRWTGENKLDGWAWPVPKDFALMCGIEHMNWKAFYVFIQALKNKKKDLKSIWNYYDSAQDLIDSFQSVIMNEWERGNNLVIGSEGMASMGMIEPNLSSLYDKILKTLPWNQSGQLVSGSDNDVTVVVKYRTPRINHVISLWHQCCMRQMNFHEYIMRLATKKDPLAIIDSLYLTKVLLAKGANVVLVDLAGVKKQGLDATNAIICDILYVPCTEDKQIVGIDEDADLRNVRAGMGNMGGVTDDQLDAMEEKLQLYDCNNVDVLLDENVQILYGSEELSSLLTTCMAVTQNQRINSRQDLARELSEILLNDRFENDDDGEEDIRY